jgi:hypothetical protein
VTQVISARKGEFETGFEKGGQTREHAMLAKTLGVRLLVVVINKMDDHTVAWSKDRYGDAWACLHPRLVYNSMRTSRPSFVFLDASTSLPCVQLRRVRRKTHAVLEVQWLQRCEARQLGAHLRAHRR